MKEFTNTEEMELFLFEEVKKSAKRETFNRYFNDSDLESYLMVRVWDEVNKNEKYQNIRGIRQIIKSRINDYFKSPNNTHKNITTFSAFTSTDDEGGESNFEDSYTDPYAPSLEDGVVNEFSGQAFLELLTDTQKDIIQLKSDGVQVNQIASSVFPDKSFDAGRKTVQREFAKIRDIALEYGLINF